MKSLIKKLDPGKNPNIWPNTAYAEYYNVDTFITK